MGTKEEEERSPLLITLSESTRELLFTYAGSRKRSYTVEAAIQEYIKKKDPALTKEILGKK